MNTKYTPQKIRDIQNTELAPVNATLFSSLHVSLQNIRAEIMNRGQFVSDETLATWQARRDDVKEQIRILEAITLEGREAYEELKTTALLA